MNDEYSSYENGGTIDHNAWNMNTKSKYKDSVKKTNLTSSYCNVTHGMEKKFTCVYCSKNFNRMWNLERHIKSVHNESFPVY